MPGRRLFGLSLGFAASVSLALLGALGAPVTAQEPADTADEEENPFQEGLPLEPTRTVSFTATEGSWMSVDVSPDGTTLVFDLLGDLYTMPIEGGRATPLTQGMAMDAQPRFSPDGSRVVFTSDRSGGEGVWIISLDRTDTTQVTRGKDTRYDSPEWTPDGDYIVVTRGTKLHLYHVDGGSGEQLVEEPPALRTMGAAFGDDPRYIWFARRNGQWEYNTAFPDYQLAVYDRESGELSTRTSRWGSAFRPTLSPDGRWLVYGTRHDQETGLRVRELATGDERWLAYPVQRDDQESRATLDVYPGMSFTPDSETLVAFYGGRLWSIPVDGSEPSEIPFEVDVVQHMGPLVDFDYEVDDSPTFTVQQIREAAPSPDGRRLAFVAMDKLRVMDYPGGEPERLDDRSLVQMNPRWSPDGVWIAYATWDDNDGGQVWKVRADGTGEPVRLTTAPALYTEPVWSPDGERLVLIRTPMASWVATENRGETELVWIPSDGGDATFIATAEGRENVHFVDGEDRIYASDGGTLGSMRWDGLDWKEIVDVDGASMVTMAPWGGEAVAQVRSHIYAVTVPWVGGEPPEIDPESASFPARKLTEVGGQWPAWSREGRRVHWSIGNAHLVYDLDRAEEVEDSVEAAERAEEDEPEEEPDTAQAAGEEEEDEEDEPAYRPEETRVVLTATRDIPDGVAVLRGGRVITMRGDEVLESGDVVVRDNRIEAVGPAGQVEVPPGAEEIDVSGTTIVPGFVDTHAHLRARGVHRAQAWSYVANLAYGVTTTRDPQTGTTDVLDYSDRVVAGEVLGPRIYSTGPGVFSSEDIEDLDHARDILRRYSEYFDTRTIKQYVSGNREQRQWIIQAAMEQELMPTTEGSLDIEMNVTEAIDGYSGHEHSWPAFPLQSDLIRFFAESGIAYTPTILVAYGGPWAENYFYANEDVHGSDKLHRFTPHSEIDGKALRRDAGWFHPDEHVFPLISRTVDDLVEAGGRAGVGSHGQLQGLGYHWELWATAAGGMDPHRALRVATILGADAIGLDTELGSIEPGKLADLVILEENPLDDLRNTNTIRMVMKNGRLYDGDTLEELYPDVRPAPTFYWQGGEPETAAGIGR